MTSQRVLELRAAFDRTFALPPAAATQAVEDFLAVKVAGDACALRVSELAHLCAQRKIVPIPGRRPDLLGLAGIRGRTVPVYSLARIMGYSAANEAPRWLVTCGTGSEVAFAFDEFERHVRIPSASISRVGAAESPRKHVHELIPDGGRVRFVVDIASMAQGITQRRDSR